MDEENDDSEELRKLCTKKKKYRARRFRVIQFYCVMCFTPFLHQKFKNRSECVLKTEEKYWKFVTVDYMSEESDTSDYQGVIIIHHVPWRSSGSCLHVI